MFLLFRDTGVRIYVVTAPIGPCMPGGTWALTDSHTNYVMPCTTLLTACVSSRAWVVQTTPVEDNWRSWTKHYEAGVYWMGVVTFDELDVLG
jgi:hypothetical protein